MGRIGWKDDRSTDSIRDLYYGGTEAGGVQNVNFLAIFWHFPNPHINWDQKSLEEQGKVEKLQNGSPYYTVPTYIYFSYLNNLKQDVNS